MVKLLLLLIERSEGVPVVEVRRLTVYEQVDRRLLAVSLVAALPVAPNHSLSVTRFAAPIVAATVIGATSGITWCIRVAPLAS